MLNRNYGLRTVAVAMIAVLWCTSASAFFPLGGFDVNQVLRIARWKVGDFDNNNDGRIDPEEGLEYYVESGRSGFTTAEIAIVDEAFQIWEDVPTSYAAFRKRGEPADPFLAGGDNPDGRISVQMEVTETIDRDDDGFPDEDTVPDPADVITGAVGGGVLGVTFVLFAADETLIDVGDDQFIISAGTMVDTDIVIDAVTHRVPVEGTEPDFSLLSTLVHEVGHLLGLGHPALNNLRATVFDPTDPLTAAGLLENEVFWMTQPDGVPRLIGVTPTMYPFSFETQDSFGDRYDGGADLAPDDISAVSWMYPRGDQSNYFTLTAEARTQVRRGSGLPSVPFVGGHVVAWADHDNDPDTGRIPMFSTMSGLYEYAEQPEDEGTFSLIGLWKQFEVQGGGGVLFDPSYTFTLNSLNQTGFERQAPPGMLPEIQDTLQGPESFSTIVRGTDEYTALSPSEVFHEVDNIVDISNKDVGTAMVWSFSQNTLVSRATGQRLSSILAGGQPMFGDPNEACPLNFISDETTTTTTTDTGAGLIVQGNNSIRDFRDQYLLNSAVGLAFVNVYYAVSPYMVDILADSKLLRELFKITVISAYWLMQHSVAVIAGLGALLMGWTLWRRRTARRTALAGIIVFAAALIPQQNADARIHYISQESFVAGATEIITGTVASTSTRFIPTGHVVTDVVVTIDDVAKGQQNKQSQITVTVPGGRSGGYVMLATEMPTFEVGERALLYIRELSQVGFVIHGGIRGKVPISTSAKSGDEMIAPDNMATVLDLRAAKAAAEAAAGGTKEAEEAEVDDESLTDAASVEEDESMTVDAYLDYLRDMVRKQRR